MGNYTISKGIFGIVCYVAITLQAIGQPVYTVDADTKGLADSPVVLTYWHDFDYHVDTIRIKQGRFTHAIPQTDDSMATLEISPTTRFTFWLEEPITHITGTSSPSAHLTCVGTPENKLLQTYRNTIERPFLTRRQGLSETRADSVVLEEHRQTRRFIKAHPSSRTSAYLLYWQAMYDVTIFDELEKLLAGLSPGIQKSYWAKRAVTRIYNVRNRPRVGRKLPTFTLPGSMGKPVSLDSFKGKYVLLDFWGTWCVPCVQGIPELKALHEKYKDRLTIISIARERPSDRDKWLRMIKTYEMDWPQAIDIAAYRDGVNELYNIWEWPTMLLADPQGVYLTKAKYGESLEDTVRKFLDK